MSAGPQPTTIGKTGIPLVSSRTRGLPNGDDFGRVQGAVKSCNYRGLSSSGWLYQLPLKDASAKRAPRDRRKMTGSEGLEELASVSAHFHQVLSVVWWRRQPGHVLSCPGSSPSETRCCEQGPVPTPLGGILGCAPTGARPTLWPHPEPTLKPYRPCLCVETSSFHHSLQTASQGLPVGTGQVFCVNAFQHTQVQ